jgi:endoglucanase
VANRLAFFEKGPTLNIDFLKRLTETPGIPGREERVRELLIKECEGLFDSTTTDAMGSLIATRKTKKKDAKRVLLACHIDQIGFYVKYVDDKGWIRLNAAGGFDTRNLFARRVRIQTAGGDVIGILSPGGRPIHIARDEDKKNIPEVGDFFIDLGLPAEEVKKKVRIGDPVTIMQEMLEIGETVCGQAMDNRIAGFVAIEAIRKLAKTGKDAAYEIIFAATVQEEVGLRGAGPATYSQKPDLAIGIDTTLCCDTPGVPDEERVTKQGAGVALTIMDSSVISDRGMIDSFEAVARKHEIPHQFSILPRGGTDTGAAQRTGSGVRAMTYSVPTRYIHSVVETVHKRDLQAAIDLLAAWLAE